MKPSRDQDRCLVQIKFHTRTTKKRDDEKKEVDETRCVKGQISEFNLKSNHTAVDKGLLTFFGQQQPSVCVCVCERRRWISPLKTTKGGRTVGQMQQIRPQASSYLSSRRRSWYHISDNRWKFQNVRSAKTVKEKKSLLSLLHRHKTKWSVLYQAFSAYQENIPLGIVSSPFSSQPSLSQKFSAVSIAALTLAAIG